MPNPHWTWSIHRQPTAKRFVEHHPRSIPTAASSSLQHPAASPPPQQPAASPPLPHHPAKARNIPAAAAAARNIPAAAAASPPTPPAARSRSRTHHPAASPQPPASSRRTAANAEFIRGGWRRQSKLKMSISTGFFRRFFRWLAFCFAVFVGINTFLRVFMILFFVFYWTFILCPK
jgi:hypothetical protein